MKTSEFIRIVLDNLRKAGDEEADGERIYRPEPVNKPPREAPVYVPGRIKEMRNIARRGRKAKNISEDRIFYEQARFMENYTDDFAYGGRDTVYIPTYENLSDECLRGYFTWRARARKKDYADCISTYILLYANEIALGIGSEPGREGLLTLCDLLNGCKPQNAWATRRLSIWIYDYAAYYNIPVNDLPPEMKDNKAEKAYLVLRDAENAPDDELYNAVTVLSSYDPEKSKFGRKYPEVLREVCCAVIRAYSSFYNRRHKRSTYAKILFGNIVNWNHTMFYDGCFYSKQPHSDCEYEINPLHSYLCSGGDWTLRQFYGNLRRSSRLGALVKATDCELRERYGFSEIKMPAKMLASQLKIIKAQTDLYLKKEEEKKKAEIKIDFSKLAQIRDNAEKTTEKLTPEEPAEQPPYSPPETDAPGDTPNAGAAGFTEEETDFLTALLTGAEYKKPANGTPVSMLADNINERLFDRFADTVIIFDGDKPVVIEEYRDELKRTVKA